MLPVRLLGLVGPAVGLQERLDDGFDAGLVEEGRGRDALGGSIVESRIGQRGGDGGDLGHGCARGPIGWAERSPIARSPATRHPVTAEVTYRTWPGSRSRLRPDHGASPNLSHGYSMGS